MPVPRHANGHGEARPYCPGTLHFFDETHLETAVVAARDFYALGGNLKFVQLLLDHNIDATLEKLHVTFLPKGATEPTPRLTEFLQQHYREHRDPRGGYERPLPGEFQPANHPLIAGGRFVEVLEPTETRERWNHSLGPMTLVCDNLMTLGDPDKDGTKWYCQPRTLQATSAGKALRLANDGNNNTSSNTNTNTKEECHVISIGGNDNWNFELNFVTVMPGCILHTFDCTLKNGTPQRKPDRHDIRFYNYCIDSQQRTDDHGRAYITYFDMVKMAELQAPPVLLKIDVEGFEYDVFSNMIQQAHGVAQNVNTMEATDHFQKPQFPPSCWMPQQIMVKLHWATRMTGVSWMLRTRTTAEIALLSSMMYNGGGYMPVFQNWIQSCTPCMEVLYFRTLC